MHRRDFIRSGAVAAAGIGLAGSAFAGEKRPNVLLIMVDQLREPKWTPLLRTPNLDRLRSRGVSFSNGFVAASPCSPSRACLVTGTYTIQNQVFENVDPLFSAQSSLDPNIPTMGHMFGAAGYQTPYRGKWHLTRSRERDKNDPLIAYGYTGWQRPDAWMGGGPWCGALQDPLYSKQAVEFLADPSNHATPWMLTVSLVNPHDICEFPRSYPAARAKLIHTEAPAPNWTDELEGKPSVQREWQTAYSFLFGYLKTDCADEWRRYLDYYIHHIEGMDRHLGLVLDALDKSGEAVNTIIAFTSDHGDMGGSHRLRAKGPMAYDEVMNVPLIFAWPGMIPAGKRTEAMGCNVDVMKTLASLAGLRDVPYQAGVDLSPSLLDPSADAGREEVIFHVNGNPEPPGGRGGNGKKQTVSSFLSSPGRIRALRTREWKFAHYFDPRLDFSEYELYNLIDDPMEMKNLAADAGSQARKKEMADRLQFEEARLKAEFRK